MGLGVRGPVRGGLSPSSIHLPLSPAQDPRAPAPARTHSRGMWEGTNWRTGSQGRMEARWVPELRGCPAILPWEPNRAQWGRHGTQRGRSSCSPHGVPKLTKQCHARCPGVPVLLWERHSHLPMPLGPVSAGAVGIQALRQAGNESKAVGREMPKPPSPLFLV